MRRLPRARREVLVALSVATTLGDQGSFARRAHVGEEALGTGAALGVDRSPEHERPHRNRNHQVRAGLAGFVRVRTGVAGLRGEQLLEPKIHQLPPRPPSPPAGPPIGTYFSRRHPTTPSPPFPAATEMVASSMNCTGIRRPGHQKEPAGLLLSKRRRARTGR
jgi:hypothetical protein